MLFMTNYGQLSIGSCRPRNAVEAPPRPKGRLLTARETYAFAAKLPAAESFRIFGLIPRVDDPPQADPKPSKKQAEALKKTRDFTVEQQKILRETYLACGLIGKSAKVSGIKRTRATMFLEQWGIKRATSRKIIDDALVGRLYDLGLSAREIGRRTDHTAKAIRRHIKKIKEKRITAEFMKHQEWFE